MISYLNKLSWYEFIFLVIGFLGQGLFASRFIIQWIYSERKGENYIPIAFWYLSIFGGLGILAYAISRIKGYSKYRTLDRLYRGIIDIIKVKKIIKE